MDNHSLRVLEFDKIRRRTADHAYSEEAREVLLEEGFCTDKGAWRLLRNRVAHLQTQLREAQEFPAVRLPEIRPALVLLEKSGTLLDPEGLGALRAYLETGGELFRFLSGREDPEGLMEDLLAEWPSLEGPAARIGRYIEGGQWREDIPELRPYISRMEEARQEIRRTARSFLQEDSSQSLWQDDLFTDRGGRTVLPLKASQRSRVEGIVHGSSSSGATLYVEPPVLVEKNNRWFQAQQELQAEQTRILRQLTEELRGELPAVQELRRRIVLWERLNARARFGLACGGEPAGLGPSIALHKVRHPLLGDEAVPIDLTIDSETRVLVISGPNTGGKTVALKTAGLMVMMNQFGLPLPAAGDSSLPLYRDVLCDVGDEQSIEASLSTFSGHMVNIAAVLEKAAPDTLVLLDELGSGTSPEEGGALAMAVLDTLIERRAPVLLTSHHGVLKHYGFSRREVQNASVEFDGEQLRPTYRIIPGLPGESHALVIAGRSGIPGEVIRRAEAYQSGGSSDVAALVRELTGEQRRLRRAAAEAEEEREGLQEKRAELEKARMRAVQREEELREEGLREMREHHRESRRTLERLIREIREEGQLSEEKIAQARQFMEAQKGEEQRQEEEAEKQKAALRESRDRLGGHGGQGKPGPSGESGDSQPEFREGDAVLVGDARRDGVVLGRGRKGSWLVQVGALRMETDPEMLERDTRTPAGGGGSPGRGGSLGKGGRKKSWEADMEGDPHLVLDVRGCRLEEAVGQVERQLDRALVQGLESFSIIHGKGSGILQKGIRDYLEERPEVDSCQFALPEAGGTGRTDVKLRG